MVFQYGDSSKSSIANRNIFNSLELFLIYATPVPIPIIFAPACKWLWGPPYTTTAADGGI
jgi:hypothetical protein